MLGVQLVVTPESFFSVFWFFFVGGKEPPQPRVMPSQCLIEEEVLVLNRQLVDLPEPFFCFLIFFGGRGEDDEEEGEVLQNSFEV